MSRHKQQAPVIAQPTKDSDTHFTADAFQNAMARMGFGTPSMLEATTYPLTRLTKNYMLMNSLYRSHWIVRRIIDVIPEDMMKRGWMIISQIPPSATSRMDRAYRQTHLRAKLLEALQWSRLYGGAAAVMMIDGHDDVLDRPLELDTIYPGSFKGLLVADRWSGIFPSTELVSDIGDGDFGKPEFYQVISNVNRQTVRVHHSRVVRFIGRSLPFWEEQAEVYWGASEVEHVYDEIKKRDNTSFNIANLVFSANLRVLQMQDLGQMLATGNEKMQAQIYNLVQSQSWLMNNFSMYVMDKDSNFDTKAYSFGGLAEVYEQFMMDISGASEIPQTRLFGRSPAGMNATGEGDMQGYYETIETQQEAHLRPALDKILPVIMISEFGAIPDDFNYEFNPIHKPSDVEKADLADKQTGTILGAFNAGLLSPRTSLKELRAISEQTGMFSNITDEDIEKASDQVQPQGEGGMPGGMPGEVPPDDDTPGGAPTKQEVLSDLGQVTEQLRQLVGMKDSQSISTNDSAPRLVLDDRWITVHSGGHAPSGSKKEGKKDDKKDDDEGGGKSYHRILISGGGIIKGGDVPKQVQGQPIAKLGEAIKKTEKTGKAEPAAHRTRQEINEAIMHGELVPREEMDLVMKEREKKEQLIAEHLSQLREERQRQAGEASRTRQDIEQREQLMAQYPMDSRAKDLYDKVKGQEGMDTTALLLSAQAIEDASGGASRNIGVVAMQTAINAMAEGGIEHVLNMRYAATLPGDRQHIREIDPHGLINPISVAQYRAGGRSQSAAPQHEHNPGDAVYISDPHDPDYGQGGVVNQYTPNGEIDVMMGNRHHIVNPSAVGVIPSEGWTPANLNPDPVGPDPNMGPVLSPIPDPRAEAGAGPTSPISAGAMSSPSLSLLRPSAAPASPDWQGLASVARSTSGSTAGSNLTQGAYNMFEDATGGGQHQNYNRERILEVARIISSVNGRAATRPIGQTEMRQALVIERFGGPEEAARPIGQGEGGNPNVPPAVRERAQKIIRSGQLSSPNTSNETAGKAFSRDPTHIDNACKNVFGRTLRSQEVRDMYKIEDVEGYKVQDLALDGWSNQLEITGNVHYNGTDTERPQGMSGHFRRTFTKTSDGLVIDHDLFTLDDKHQGKGVAMALNYNAEQTYRKLGAKYVKVHADIDVGLYTWAREGFDFDDNFVTGPLRGDTAHQKWENIKQFALSYNVNERQLIQANGGKVPEHAWEFAELNVPGKIVQHATRKSDKDGNPVMLDCTLGKAFMLQDGGWYGRKILDPTTQCSEIGDKYMKTVIEKAKVKP